MTQTSKLRRISGLKTQNNEKENISLTTSLLFDNFIARGQGRENKNLVFFPTALKKKNENQTQKARVMQATQIPAPPKLTLHMLSAKAHNQNSINQLYFIFQATFLILFCLIIIILPNNQVANNNN